MAKIAFLGAGSTIFAKNVLGDCMRTPALAGSTYSLHDIDPVRLEDSRVMLERIRTTYNVDARIETTLSAEDALTGADYVVNAIQVGGYEPSTVIDFEIPKKYGLRQTIGDTLGIGGIFRALRTIPVVLEFGKTLERVSPDAYFINYVNPMCMLTDAWLRSSSIAMVGLCHSVQECVPGLLEPLGLEPEETSWKIYGINHQAWLLELTRDGVDLYPEVKRLAAQRTAPHDDMVRYELMNRFGYYVTESSEHNAEYTPWFIKRTHPELIEKYNIPLDEYPRRCIKQSEQWAEMREELTGGDKLDHERSVEYASYIIEAMEGGIPSYTFAGNVRNSGLIPNLPAESVVEVTCVAERGRVTPCHMGPLPPQCAALNRTNINVQLLAVEAVLTRRRDTLYQAAMMDPATAAELSIDEIVSLCDDLLEAHGEWVPQMT